MLCNTFKQLKNLSIKVAVNTVPKVYNYNQKYLKKPKYLYPIGKVKNQWLFTDLLFNFMFRITNKYLIYFSNFSNTH